MFSSVPALCSKNFVYSKSEHSSIKKSYVVDLNENSVFLETLLMGETPAESSANPPPLCRSEVTKVRVCLCPMLLWKGSTRE